MTDRYRFDCPACDMAIVVDAGVRADVLLAGCPVCGAPSRQDQFEEIHEPGELL